MAIDDQPMNVYWSGQRTETINRSKINYKGSVAAFSDLPDTGNQKGDMYSVTGLNGENYIWNGTVWDSLGTSDANVVHKTGNETIDGVKTFTSQISAYAIKRGVKNSSLYFMGGDDYYAASGAKLYLYGGQQPTTPGELLLQAGNSDGHKQLYIKPDGTLTWDGNAMQTASDERLKTSLDTVPDDVLDAWGDVHWGQFQFLDAMERKGESARLHLGLIAQRVKTTFEARGLDACRYGILCHEERSATEGEPAVDLWMVRYEEALAMEAAYQRRRANRLEARIAVLEAKLA